MEYLVAEDILNIHSVIIDETKGAHGVRDRNTLASLEHLPHQQAFGRDLYPNLFLKAAVYVRTIMFSHPFVDGNKRTAMTSAAIFLELNGYRISTVKGEIESFAVSVVVAHKSLEEISEWLREKSIRI